MTYIQALLLNNRIIPILTIEKIEWAVPVATAILEAGINVIEITLRTDAALPAIEAINKELPNISVIAGTILLEKQISQAKNVGAKGGISPGWNANLVKAAEENNFPYLPGVATPTEAMQAVAHGFTVVKVFPVELLGGIKILSAFQSILPNLKFFPSGGINSTNISIYLKHPSVIAVGSSAPINHEQLKHNEWAKITQTIKDFI